MAGRPSRKAYLAVPMEHGTDTSDSGVESLLMPPTFDVPAIAELPEDSEEFGNGLSTSAPNGTENGHSGARKSLEGLRRRASFLDFSHKISEVGRSMKTAADKELKHEVLRFTQTTTAHGVPMILNSRNCFSKGCWSILTVASVIVFTYQCMLVADKYHRKDKIVNVELQFEQAAFPAVTVCNLNPFKNHLARKVPEISETLDAFHQAVTYSKDAAEHYDESEPSGGGRFRRSHTNPGGFRYVQYEPVMSDCECKRDAKGVIHDCVQKDSIPRSNSTLCICNFDRQDSTAWPCFHLSKWIESTCPECNDIGYCNLPETNGTTELPCLCQEENYCLLRPERLKRIWEVRGTEIPDESSPYRADFMAQLKQLGYENMTDEVAITTKTKEKLILTMAGLPFHRRIALSYGKAEFIKMCSFNGQQCNIINDFKLHVDPAFGNCYTFNANREEPLVSSRAGPSYGLRLMVYINSSDHLPTTESTGVRIAIHGQSEYPFPDTFGYSAPTGAVSSFGMAMRKVNRLSEPYGDCVTPDQPLPPNYIYRNYNYEPEGCYKSCYQQRIIRRCGCADPRYPIADNDTVVCDSWDPISRNCLIVEGIRFTKKNTCHCKHPCSHNVWTTTYSSARLASGAFRGSNCKEKEKRTAESHCFEYDGNNAAMIEIYYEQMSFEVLTERESYLFVNMISDVGGQAGLWLGASILTVIEVCMFLMRVLTMYCRRRLRHSSSEVDFAPTRYDEDDRRTAFKPSPTLAHYGPGSTPRVLLVRRKHSLGSPSLASEGFADDSDTALGTELAKDPKLLPDLHRPYNMAY